MPFVFNKITVRPQLPKESANYMISLIIYGGHGTQNF